MFCSAYGPAYRMKDATMLKYTKCKSWISMSTNWKVKPVKSNDSHFAN